MAKDDVLFLYVEHKDVTCILFVCDTYLYSKQRKFYGKLMYLNKKVHGEYTLPGKKYKQIFYNCAYCYTTNKNIRPLSDEELQNIGKTLSLFSGVGIDKHLSGPAENWNYSYLYSPLFNEQYHSKKEQLFANEIGQKYGVDPDDLKITGGLHLFPTPINESHDVDIVIPIDSNDQLTKIFYHIHASKEKPVIEYGYMWPLRWFSSGGHLICPFFVYRNLLPPIDRFVSNGKNFKGKVNIIDDIYGVFNAPLLITDGGVRFVFCRSTLLRGMLRKGKELHLDCPEYKVTSGLYKGNKVAIVTNPFKEIANIKDLLSEYHS